MKRERWNKLFAAMDAASLDAVVLVPGPNLRYLTGGVFPLRERPNLVVLKADGHIVVILPALEETSWHKLSIEADVTLWVDSDGYTPSLRKVFGSGRGATTAFAVSDFKLRHYLLFVRVAHGLRLAQK